MAIGEASSFAPNAAKAQTSAEKIFELLDMVPTIDSYNPEGMKPNEVIPQKHLLVAWLLSIIPVFSVFFCSYNRKDPKFSDRQVWANSADPDQTAPRGAV